jgi:hypothetical protein
LAGLLLIAVELVAVWVLVSRNAGSELVGARPGCRERSSVVSIANWICDLNLVQLLGLACEIDDDGTAMVRGD